MSKPTAQLSTIDQIILTLGCLVFFSIAIAFAGFMGGAETRAKLAAFASEGIVVTGAVTGKNINVVGKARTWVHWLDVMFTSADGTTRTLSANVANTVYDRYAVGSPVQVTYVSSKPEWFYVPDGEPTPRDAGISDGMLVYGTLVAVLCAIGLVGVVIHRRNNSAETVASVRVERLSRAGMSASNPRARFGTRRA